MKQQKNLNGSRATTGTPKGSKGEEDMHIAVRRYEGVRNTDELGRHFREEFSPLITGIRGCIGYYLVDAGGGTVCTVSIFEDAAGAQESINVAADWVKKHPDVLPAATQVTAGEVIGHTVKQTV